MRRFSRQRNYSQQKLSQVNRLRGAERYDSRSFERLNLNGSLLFQIP